jgi:hypothetical protein
MPGRRLGRTRLFDQDVLVEDLHLARAHDPAGDRGGGRVQDEVAVFRNARPVAVVLEEAAALALADILDGMGARFLQIALEAGAQGVDPVLEGAAYDDDAIAGIGGAEVVGEGDGIEHMLALARASIEFQRSQ